MKQPKNSGMITYKNFSENCYQIHFLLMIIIILVTLVIIILTTH